MSSASHPSSAGGNSPRIIQSGITTLGEEIKTDLSSIVTFGQAELSPRGSVGYASSPRNRNSDKLTNFTATLERVP